LIGTKSGGASIGGGNVTRGKKIQEKGWGFVAGGVCLLIIEKGEAVKTGSISFQKGKLEWGGSFDRKKPKLIVTGGGLYGGGWQRSKFVL